MEFSEVKSCTSVRISSGVTRGFGSMILSAFLVVILLPPRSDALYCYNCLAMECPGDQSECEAVRDFVVEHLRSFYDLDLYLRTCKAVNESLEWSLQQLEEEPCRDNTISATCTAGRMQIKTKRGLEKPILITHATILGCANRALLESMKRSAGDNRCDMIKRTGTTNDKYELKHELELEHCSQIETVCHKSDFCVSHEQSVVKAFIPGNRSLARFDVGLVLGIVAFIIVVFAAIVGASLCSFPLNRPSNLPKSSTEDTDLVAIRSSKSDDSIHKQGPSDEIETLNQ